MLDFKNKAWQGSKIKALTICAYEQVFYVTKLRISSSASVHFWHTDVCNDLIRNKCFACRVDCPCWLCAGYSVCPEDDFV